MRDKLIKILDKIHVYEVIDMTELEDRFEMTLSYKGFEFKASILKNDLKTMLDNGYYDALFYLMAMLYRICVEEMHKKLKEKDNV